MLGNTNANTSSSAPVVPASSEPANGHGNSSSSNKRKRRPAGTPDPDAEVVSLSPKTLLESDRYVCEICNQGFQRDQNLQMHRRRHKVPWKLLKRENPGGPPGEAARKRVFVCPEPACLHHDPRHALGDLVGIKKHYRRKHSDQKQWVCERCSKGYAVQSDYKAHLKTCGTRGHSCDCGRVFSRVESFIEHQDSCNAGRVRSELQPWQLPCLSRTASSPSQSSDTNFSATPNLPPFILPKPRENPIPLLSPTKDCSSKNGPDNHHHNLELQLSSSSIPAEAASISSKGDEKDSTPLQLSIGSCCDAGEKNESNNATHSMSNMGDRPDRGAATLWMREEAREQLRLAMAEKAYAEEARELARRQIQMAQEEFANAQRIRQQAQSELDKALALREHASKQINSAVLQITCHACKKQFQARAVRDMANEDEKSSLLVFSYTSSVVTGGEVGER
ncbi:protein indeterminate-domain 16-like [Rhodamnia argentea]|uniref:Protein indeterminate-domain 16-like n=1 Tax=Rhodamnia argentea TaxID=178133 RepID=A0A8B8NI79_9MYRT|nr:protein indeterminate-domain 16-like [Rhodamnia argentea]